MRNRNRPADVSREVFYPTNHGGGVWKKLAEPAGGFRAFGRDPFHKIKTRLRSDISSQQSRERIGVQEWRLINIAMSVSRPRAAFHPPRRCSIAASPDRSFVRGAAFSENEGRQCGQTGRSRAQRPGLCATTLNANASLQLPAGCAWRRPLQPWGFHSQNPRSPTPQ